MELAYRKIEGGEGAPVVFLHGLLRNRNCFAPLLSAVLTGRPVYALDQAGHGDSPRLDSYRVVDHLPGLVSFLEHESGNRGAVLYGHSMGAMLSLAIAAQRPDLVRAVVLEDPPFHTMGRRLAGTPLETYFRALQPHLGAGTPWRVLSAVRAGERTLGELRDATQLRFMARCLAGVSPQMLDAVLAGQWLDGYDAEENWRALRCPALLLQADPAAGGMLTDEDASAALRYGADVALMRLPGVGHQIHWQDPPAVARHLLAFLASVD